MKKAIVFGLLFILIQVVLADKVVHTDVPIHPNNDLPPGVSEQLTIIYKARSKIEELISVLKTAEDDKKEAEGKLEETNEAIQKGQGDIDKAKADEGAAKKSKEKADDEITAAETELRQAMEELAKAEKTIQEEGVKIDDIDKMLKEPEGRKKSLNQEVENLIKDIAREEANKNTAEKDKGIAQAQAAQSIYVVNSNCRSITYAFPDGHYCPSGYNELWCINRSAPDSCCDALRLCDKTSIGSGQCDIGYYVVGLDHSNMGRDGIVPKKLHGYIRVIASWGGVAITMRNGATGETRVITGNCDIPYSATQDQPISFIRGYGDGIIVLYTTEREIDADAQAAQKRAEENVRNAQTKIDAAEAARKQAQEKKEKIDADIRDLTSKVTELNNQKQEVETRKSKAADAKTQATATQKQKEQERATSIATKAEQENRINMLLQEIKRLEIDLEPLKSKKVRLDKEIDGKIVEILEHEKARDKAKDDFEKANARLEELNYSQGKEEL